MFFSRVVVRTIYASTIFLTASCQPPGINQRILHKPHSLYLEQLAQNEIPNYHRNQLAVVRTEELGKLGIPKTCKSMSYSNQFCLECDDDPVPVKRCRKGINMNFSVDKHCRYSATSVKCLDPKTRLSLSVPLRGNQDSRFLVQFDMILETLDIIFRNEISEQADLIRAKTVLHLVGESKIGLFDNDPPIFNVENPKTMAILAKLSDKDRAIILEKLKSGYDKLEHRRVSGDLSSKDALQFLVDLFEASKSHPKIISIVKDVDVQGLNSL